MNTSSTETPSASPNSRPSHLGWVLDGTTIQPTSATAQKIVQVLNAASDESPDLFVTFTFPCFQNAAPIQIHRHVLESASAPLSELVTSQPSDGIALTVELHEHPDVFAIVRKFIYAIPIDLAQADARLPLAANRWQLKPLVLAFFSVVMRRSSPRTSTFLSLWPVLIDLVAPWQFQNYLARLVCFNILEFENDFGWSAVWGDFHDDRAENRSLEQVVSGLVVKSGSQNSRSLTAVEEFHSVQDSALHGGDGNCTECQQNLTRLPDESESLEDMRRTPLGLWKAFKFQGKLPRAIWTLSRFGSCDRSKHLLYLTKLVESELSDEQLEDIACFIGEGTILLQAASDAVVQPRYSDHRLLRAAIRVAHRVRWYVDEIAMYRGELPTNGESFKETLDCVRGASLVGADVIAEVISENSALVLQVKCEAFASSLFHISAEVSLSCCDCVVPFGGLDLTKHSVLTRKSSEKLRTRFELMSLKDILSMRSTHARCSRKLRLVVLLQPR